MQIKKYVDKFIEIVYHENLNFAEMQGACVSLGWGLWMLFLDKESPSGLLLAHIMPVRVLGIISLFVGLLQAAALLREARPWRRYCAMGSMIIWLFVALVLTFYDWKFSVVPLMYMFAFAAAWAFWRMGRSRY